MPFALVSPKYRTSLCSIVKITLETETGSHRTCLPCVALTCYKTPPLKKYRAIQPGKSNIGFHTKEKSRNSLPAEIASDHSTLQTKCTRDFLDV